MTTATALRTPAHVQAAIRNFVADTGDTAALRAITTYAARQLDGVTADSDWDISGGHEGVNIHDVHYVSGDSVTVWNRRGVGVMLDTDATHAEDGSFYLAGYTSLVS
jgi:hypothetical protein